MPTRPFLLAVAFAAASTAAHAQTFDPAWLDRQAEERNAAQGQQPPAPPAQPVSPSQRQVYHRPPGLIVCMGVPQWTPILAAPSPSASVVAYTIDVVAVTSRTDRAYTQVLLPNGQGHGYVPKHLVSAYSSPLKPGGTCSVTLDSENRPRFGRR